MDRSEVLLAAAKITTQDRNLTYGEPVEQLAHAQILKGALGHRDAKQLSLVEIECLEMICTKLSRIVIGTPTLDGYQDIINYAAIAAEARSVVPVLMPETKTERENETKAETKVASLLGQVGRNGKPEKTPSGE